MEAMYGGVGPEFAKATVPGYVRTFFRGNKSVADLRRIYVTTEWDRAENDAVVYSGKVIPLDADAGCVESCEVDWSTA